MSAGDRFARADSRLARWICVVCLVTGAVAANIAFVGLGSSFDYPDILQEPATDILVRFDEARSATIGWFLVLTLGALLIGPAAILLARRGSGRSARWSAWAGAGAATVQVVGLSRWVLLVPGIADRVSDPAATPLEHAEALADFDRAHHILGTIVGETLGYALTAGWTALVILAFPHLPSWFRALGAAGAVLILSGVLVPLDVAGTDLANFLGYVLWTVWLLVLAGLVARGGLAGDRRRTSPDLAVQPA